MTDDQLYRRSIEMIRKILCAIGWHKWAWLLSEVGYIDLDGPPPDCAKCKYCGVRYGEDEPS